MSWASIGQTVAGIVGGAGGVEGIRWLRGRSGDKAQTDVNHAASYNQLAQAVSTLSTAFSDLQARFDAAEEKMSGYRQAQSRLENLLRHAIEVVRDCLDILREHDIPAPAMSDELLAEITTGT
ncbi:hypothetical protein [Nocardia sp. NPDC046763]|uniref:hypothetical protein n=1 Tax=Nocardia sp. NPDC046763 TaxID=3155256 RepID=UPI0033D9291A